MSGSNSLRLRLRLRLASELGCRGSVRSAPKRRADPPADGDPDRTIALRPQAATPQAIAEASAAQPSTGAKPSGWGTSHRRVPTTADALDRSDLPRMFKFHLFGMLAPAGAIVLSLLLGGDPFARVLFWIGAAILSLCNVGLA